MGVFHACIDGTCYAGSSFAQGTMVKGLLGATLGMAFALPGIDSSIGQARLTFGSDALLAGFGLLPVLIGAFAISQILRDSSSTKKMGNYGITQAAPALIFRSDIRYRFSSTSWICNRYMDRTFARYWW